MSRKKMNHNYLLIFLFFLAMQLDFYHCEILTSELDYIDLKEIPAYLHNDNINLTILYRCSSLTRRAISLSIDVEQSLYQTKLTVFRRHWYCHSTSHIQTRSISIKLHRSVAYASDAQSSLYSWPVEHGQLSLVMFDNEQRNENQILKKVHYDIRFLPVHQRPKIYSERWIPPDKTVKDEYCPSEPEIVQVVNYPLVLAGSPYGKHVILPSFTDYNLRWKQAVQVTRPKFSVVFWIYVDEYCSHEIDKDFCSVLQHVTFDNRHLSPELFFNREGLGQLLVYMFGYLYNPEGIGARTVHSIPKKDWCRVAFVVNEETWTLYINCHTTWHTTLIIPYNSPASYHYADEIGTFIIGGNDHRPSFRGIIAQMDIYRLTALSHEQLPQVLHHAVPSFLPVKTSEAAECTSHLSSFEQYRTQLNLFQKRIRKRSTCSASPFQSLESNHQCLLIGTWKKKFNSLSSDDLHYRIFRSLRRGMMNSTHDLGNKLYRLAMELLENDYSKQSCQRVLAWLHQAACYDHLEAHSLLATFYHFGLCGLTPNLTRTVNLLITGALLKDRLSLLALGHRHYYGFDGIPQDYDAAYPYYQQVAGMSRYAMDHPNPNEVAMHRIRLTSDSFDDHIAVFDWLRDQARRGVVSAQQSVGVSLYNGGLGLARDIQVALHYFHLAANQNDAQSLFMFGLARLRGIGIEKNVTEGLHHIEEAVRHGCKRCMGALGEYAYDFEQNYTKAADYWQTCYNLTRDIYCAHHLGVLWTAGQYPPTFQKDYNQALEYHIFAAQSGHVDSSRLLASYFALGGHPILKRSSHFSASWARYVADENSVVGTIVDRALGAYRDNRLQTSYLFYLQAALAGSELGNFNAGYLCYELKVDYDASIDCIEQLLRMSLLKRGTNLQNESYDLLTMAEFYQSKKETSTKSIELYIQLFQQGDPRGLFGLAQMEENNGLISLNIWDQIGVKFENQTLEDKYRRLQTIYQHCRSLTLSKSDESYIPCTMAFSKVSIIIFLSEHHFILTIIALLTMPVCILWLNLL